MDHFMMDGVKALFKFTIAILHLAFQVKPPASNDVIGTIRNVALELTDTKLLLSLVRRIKLPNSTYFAVKRSFYMIQSSFNSDLFYLQTLSIESRRQFDPSRALSVQPTLKTKVPANSLINSPLTQFNPADPQQDQASQASIASNRNLAALCSTGSLGLAPRVCCSADKTKICVQNLGQKGRSHLRLINTEVRTHERALMSPLRNCLVIGLSDCGKQIIVARQSSRRNFKLFREQDLTFHVHELQAEVFDGFYLEKQRLAFIISHSGELTKITYKDNQNYYQKQRQQQAETCTQQQQPISANAFSFMTETLLLRDCHASSGDHITMLDRIKLKLTSFDPITNLLWIYLECEQQLMTTPSYASAQDSAGRPALGTLPKTHYNHDYRLDNDDNNNNYGDESGNIDYFASSLKESLNEIARDQHEQQRHNYVIDAWDRTSPNPFSESSSSLPIKSRMNKHSSLSMILACEEDASRLRDRTPQSNEQAESPESPPKVTPAAPPSAHQSVIHRNNINVPTTTTTTRIATRTQNLRKILVIDTQTFDIFSSFSLHQNMGPILSMRTCLVAFCHFSNPMSSQFSSRIIKIEPTGHYEHLLSFSDVVDFMITIQSDHRRAKPEPETCKQQQDNRDSTTSRVKRFLSRATSFGRHSDDDMAAVTIQNNSHNHNNEHNQFSHADPVAEASDAGEHIGSSLQKYCRAILGEGSSTSNGNGDSKSLRAPNDGLSLPNRRTRNRNTASANPGHADFVPMNMNFIFKNGKIALFEFTQPYSIRTRQSQLGRYDYSKIIDIRSSGDDFIISILTVLDKLIKVVV